MRARLAGIGSTQFLFNPFSPNHFRTKFSSLKVEQLAGKKPRPPFLVQTQTFAFPTSVTTMAPTVTRLGITNPQILGNNPFQF